VHVGHILLGVRCGGFMRSSPTNGDSKEHGASHQFLTMQSSLGSISFIGQP
jgi:hypothetical protein